MIPQDITVQRVMTLLEEREREIIDLTKADRLALKEEILRELEGANRQPNKTPDHNAPAGSGLMSDEFPIFNDGFNRALTKAIEIIRNKIE